MTAINDLVEAAGSLRVGGRAGMLGEAAASLAMPFSMLYDSVPRVSAPPAALGLDRPEGAAAAPIDVYALVEAVLRSTSGLAARTASVPEIYTRYVPMAMPASTAGPSAQPAGHAGPAEPAVSPYAATASVGPSAPFGSGGALLPGLALEKLRDEFAGLTGELAEVERLIGEALRMPESDAPAISGPVSMPPIHEERSGYDGPSDAGPVVLEKTMIVEKAGEKPVREAPRYGDAPRPSRLAAVLALGVGLPRALRTSGAGLAAMPRIAAVDVPAMTAAVAGPVMLDEAPGAAKRAAEPAGPASAADIASPQPAPPAPLDLAMDVGRMFRSLVVSCLAMRGTAPGRSATRDGVTQLLLSLPGQKAAEDSASGLFAALAGLQAPRLPAVAIAQEPVVIPAPAALEAASPPAGKAPSGASQAHEAAMPDVVPTPGEGLLRSTVLGDLRDLRGAILSLQDVASGLGKAGIPPVAEFPNAAEAPAPPPVEISGDVPFSMPYAPEGASVDLRGVYGAIGGVRAALDYLRTNVPTLADFVVLQRAVAAFVPVAGPTAAAAPPSPAEYLPAAVPPAAPVIAVEGVPASAPVVLPDLSWVAREFGQMRGMIARLQVPMYASGGLVEEPTLAFVGETEPEWIVPQSTLEDFHAKIADFQAAIRRSYGLLWDDVQALGTSMQQTVDGVNEALASATSTESTESSSSEGKEYEVDYEKQLTGVVSKMLDPYLKDFYFSIDDLKGSITSIANAGFFTAVSGMASLYGIEKVKEQIFGTTEEEKSESGGDGGGGDAESDDEEDFWALVEEDSFGDKRDGKFDGEES